MDFSTNFKHCMQHVSFSIDTQLIHGTLFTNKISSPTPAVLFIHGWTSNESGYAPRAEAITNLGHTCLTFNLRGHGSSDGKLEQFSRADHLRDAIAAYDFLASQPYVDPHAISVVGASYGGYLASLLTAQRPIISLVLRAPALYPDEQFTSPTLSLIKENIQIYRQKHLTYRDNKALQAIHSFSGKILLIESQQDETIPKETIQNYIQAVMRPTQLVHSVIPDADHRLSTNTAKQQFIDVLVDWFKNK
jgi:uncharacterized protein